MVIETNKLIYEMAISFVNILLMGDVEPKWKRISVVGSRVSEKRALAEIGERMC